MVLSAMILSLGLWGFALGEECHNAELEEAECNADDLSLLQKAQREQTLAWETARRDWWLQVGTGTGDDCATDSDIYGMVKGGGKDSGWSHELSGQYEGNNLEKGDVAVYVMDCSSSDCPEDDEVDTVCLKLESRFITSNTWCPVEVRLFSKPGFKQLGRVVDFGMFHNDGEVICKPLAPAGSLPKPPTSTVTSHIAFWADFGLSRAYKDAILNIWPDNNALGGPGFTREGAFAMYDGYQDWVQNQGETPEAIFQLGDNGYVGGESARLAKVTRGIATASANTLGNDKQFPALGNHDVNGPSGCAATDLGKCYYGNRATAGQSAETSGFDFAHWNASWWQNYPGLAGGKAIVPPSSGSVKWGAPFRYNVDMGSQSSVYFIVGLVPGAVRTTWAPGQPDVAKPVSADLMKGKSSNAPGDTYECNFLSDSIKHGKSLGKTVFVYLTHDGPHPVTKLFSKCDDVYKQLDVWLFGHEHFMDLSATKLSTVTQESRTGQAPVRFLLGNGGFDEGQANMVSFVSMKEYKDLATNRVQLHFQAYDTCVSGSNCPEGTMIPEIKLATCWKKCLDISGGYNNRKAVPSKDGYAFVYDAPMLS